MNVNDIAIRLAEIYSQALFALARDSGAVDAVKGDLDTLAGIMAQDADFVALMASPYFSDQYKEQLVHKVFSGRLDDLTVNFLKVVVEHNRMVFLLQIIDRFNELWDNLHGRAIVKITVSEPINDDEIKKISEDIAAAMKRPADVELAVNPEIIGGAVVHYGDRVIDNSIKGRLHRAVTAVTSQAKRGLEINEV
jgi:F-type H+-transporting ATPase subunit delta